jgi:hypothetical protein
MFTMGKFTMGKLKSFPSISNKEEEMDLPSLY